MEIMPLRRTARAVDLHELLSRHSHLGTGAVVALMLLLAGCGVGQLCDPGQTHSNGVCYAPDGPPAVVDAHRSYEHFGDVCVVNADCAAPTSFCARLPADPTGYCTDVGCLTEPAVCPASWGCFDLSVLQAGLPSICTKP
ncbi:MAG: hypothetical protein M3680_24280 [Myxococcota bacterium]|nr:hypothetical protein [Myxococcota bacterium]